MAERHAEGLAELADLGRELARAYAKAAKEAMQVGDWHHGPMLGAAFDRAARGVRMTMALEAKLARDARRGAVEDLQSAHDVRSRAVAQRKDEVRAAVGRLIWTEADPRETHRLRHELSSLLLEEEHLPGFADDPIEKVVARIRRVLRLPEPNLAPDLDRYDESRAESGLPAPTIPPAPDSVWARARPGARGQAEPALRPVNSS